MVGLTAGDVGQTRERWPLRFARHSRTALPSGCHEVAVRGGAARHDEGDDGMTFSKNLRLVRGKVASRKELSHQR